MVIAQHAPQPSNRQQAGTPVVTRVNAAASPFTTTAGRRAVSYKCLANAGGEVTVEGVEVDENTGHTFWDPDRLQPPIDFVVSAAGLVEVIEELV